MNEDEVVIEAGGKLPTLMSAVFAAALNVIRASQIRIPVQ